MNVDHPDRRWAALALLCAAQFLVVLDASIVNVALPSIKEDLGFAQNDLAISVAMSGKLALKAGLQTRHNTEVDEAAGVRRTDTLTTLNLVYSFR